MPTSPSLPIVDQDFDSLEPSPYNRGRWWLPTEERELTCGTRIVVCLGEAVVPGRVEYDHEIQRYVMLVHNAAIVLRAGLKVNMHHD